MTETTSPKLSTPRWPHVVVLDERISMSTGWSASRSARAAAVGADGSSPAITLGLMLANLCTWIYVTVLPVA